MTQCPAGSKEAASGKSLKLLVHLPAGSARHGGYTEGHRGGKPYLNDRETSYTSFHWQSEKKRISRCSPGPPCWLALVGVTWEAGAPHTRLALKVVAKLRRHRGGRDALDPAWHGTQL